MPPAPQKEPTPEIISDKDKDVETEETTVETPVREATPDIIRKSPVKEVPAENGQQQKSNNSPAKEIVENGHNEEQSTKKIITSEEEAKARLAEKRREMKEKMEREAEIERQRQLEEERKEAERLAQQEEEERKEREEAERLAQIARKAEEERLQKAIEEAQKREEEEKKRKEEEETKRKEAERRAQEEAERKQAELDEKLRKDEEERLARKKRLEEIMARTRGGKSANSTPKKVKVAWGFSVILRCVKILPSSFRSPFRSRRNSQQLRQRMVILAAALITTRLLPKPMRIATKPMVKQHIPALIPQEILPNRIS